MVLKGTDADGATPPQPDDIEGLIPDHIQTRQELDEWEQRNIIEAESRLRARRPRDILDDKFLRDLHSMMFGDTWNWAGQYRTRVMNVGVEPHRIPVAVRELCANTRYRREHRQDSPDVLAVRFHHELVSIHPFRNGNGRHSRLAADLLVESLGSERFSWGGSMLNYTSNVREHYLAALRDADNGDIEPLIAFARS